MLTFVVMIDTPSKPRQVAVLANGVLVEAASIEDALRIFQDVVQDRVAVRTVHLKSEFDQRMAAPYTIVDDGVIVGTGHLDVGAVSCVSLLGLRRALEQANLIPVHRDQPS